MKKLLIAWSLIVLTLILVGCRHDSYILERVSKEEQEKFIEDYIKKDTNEDLLTANFDCRTQLAFHFYNTDSSFQIDASFYIGGFIRVRIRKQSDFAQEFYYQDGFYEEYNICEFQNGNSSGDVVEYVQKIELSRKEFVEKYIRDFCMIKLELKNGKLYRINGREGFIFKYNKSNFYERDFFGETIKIKFKEVTISPNYDNLRIFGSETGKKSYAEYVLLSIL